MEDQEVQEQCNTNTCKSILAQKLEQFSTAIVEASINELSELITASENVNEKTRNELNKTLGEVKEIVHTKFSEIDKQELLDMLTEVATKVNQNDEESFKEAQKTMKKFIKKYKKKKFIFF
uniref:Uncharacterized protein n=1 Tax=Cacopsylla melanoneura TaxID=428564 RepID=A0A8D9BWE6_9HEMI